MAFFKLRKAAGESAAPAPAPESVDALRRRARYRLAGAAILVLAGVIGFPLLFDNQPRPIAVDIPIDIPDKAKVKPLAVAPASEAKPVAAAESAVVVPEASAARAATNTVVAAASGAKESKPQPKELQKEEVIISSSKPEPGVAPAKAQDKAAAKVEDKPVAKPEVKAEAKASDKKADKPADKAADSAGRFIVQFGAFTDSAHAHEARLKVEKTGLKTYAQIAETPDGKKFRVRVGPFDKRSDAEKAAEKIKKVGLPTAILGL
jgi:DedD protein